MARCSKCGAEAPDALRCPYCGQVTALGIERARWQQQANEQAQMGAAAAWYRERAAHARTAVGAANASLAVGVASLFLCCLPLGVVPIVFSLRSRKLAREVGMATPATASWGLFFGVASLFVVAAFWTATGITVHRDQVANDARVAELEKTVTPHAADRVLSHDTACQLAELHVRREGYLGTRSNIERVRCEGRLDVKDDTATLEDFRFSLNRDVTTVVCFKYGVRWYVQAMKDTPSLEADASAEAATPN